MIVRLLRLKLEREQAMAETTVTAGTFDFPGFASAPVIHYVTRYTEGTYVINQRYDPPCDPNPPILDPSDTHHPEFGDGPCLKQALAPKYGGRVSVPTDATLNVVFKINWPDFPDNPVQPLEMVLTLGAETKVVRRDSASVEFKNVAGASAPIQLRINGAVFSGGGTIHVPVTIPGLLPLIIERV
jgi:hypothetical protein